MRSLIRAVLPIVVVVGCVLGHNYSLWLSLAKRRIIGGKGLATGGGAGRDESDGTSVDATGVDSSDS